MDKNTIIGFALIAAVLIGFSVLSKPSAEELAKEREQIRRDSIEYAQTTRDAEQRNASSSNSVKAKDKGADDFFAVTAPVQNDSVAVAANVDSLNTVVDTTLVEQIITLENEKVKVSFSTKGGQMVKAQLKGYNRFDNDSLYLFNQDSNLDLLLTNKNGKVLRTGDLIFTPVPAKDKESLIMRYAYANDQYIDFIYMLSEDDYMMKYDINVVGLQPMLAREKADLFELRWSQKMRRQEKSLKNEQRYSHVYYKYMASDVEELSADKNESKEVKEPTKWIAFKNQFFASILIADDRIEVAQLDSKVLTSEDYLKACEAILYVPATVDINAGTMHAGFSYYLGPMSYSHLKEYDANIKDVNQQLDLDKLVPLGWALFRWVNQYFVIPLFNMLKSTGLSIGIVILLLTLIVKLIISPLTYKSFMSSAKMRVLRPQVEELNAKYPKPEQATEKQQAVMALYSRAGANPMSGCIPMLLQMPILIALFQFFPNAIELRHQSFLWAPDLSTYDAIIEWSNPIWIIGNHISLFCILMTITNIVYTKFNMEATNTGQQQMPGMKWMMYLMPIVFFFVLNDYPSGLTYYYFISLLITILLTLAFRFAINEDKVLAKLEANKAKPKKKSGFMARLEEAQRLQQQQAKGNAKKGAANKKKK
ncbi:membrane protein insertase YidC [Dysgonomonas sp. ZJ709]|uniref:membrane protein insertase YidC n=1 Tax=Dysgonomonas sp. ZJ709 TaxID=2709797 RepID=UPI0013EB8FFB|nr:membrane protein insertase YidC [Dysgonomonas sp. ZJ709]